MVRFHWHVEASLSAFVVGPQLVHDLDGTDNSAKILEIPARIEMPGQKETSEGIINVRDDYLKAGTIEPVGVVLGHDAAAETAKGKLLTQLALKLAGQGVIH
jgi:hypothetical protein